MSLNKKHKKNPIRVLHVIGSMNHGGAQSFIMNIYRKIDRSKIQFDFIVHTQDKCVFDDEISSLGGVIYHCPKYKGKNHFKYVKWWDSFFRNHTEYGIVHGHVRSTAVIYLKIAKQYQLITIAHSHSTSSGRGLKGIIKDIMQFPIRYIADYMLACSKAAGVWLFGRNIDNDNFYIVKNSIEAEQFIFNEVVRNKIRGELNIEGKFVIGHVGRFDLAKNHFKLIEIFKSVYDNNTNSILLLVGDGEFRESVENKVNQYGLRNRVVFTGRRSDISNLMQAMDVFIFPSLWEGLGIVTIEAQATGLPCIVSDAIPKEAHITDLIEVVDLKETSEIWAKKILKYYNYNRRESDIESVIDHGYDVNDTVKWIEDFYSKVIKK